MTSGKPSRSERCWSILAKPASSKGRFERLSSASADGRAPLSTCFSRARIASRVMIWPLKRKELYRRRRRGFAEESCFYSFICQGSECCLYNVFEWNFMLTRGAGAVFVLGHYVQVLSVTRSNFDTDVAIKRLDLDKSALKNDAVFFARANPERGRLA